MIRFWCYSSQSKSCFERNFFSFPLGNHSVELRRPLWRPKTGGLCLPKPSRFWTRPHNINKKQCKTKVSMFVVPKLLGLYFENAINCCNTTYFQIQRILWLKYKDIVGPCAFYISQELAAGGWDLPQHTRSTVGPWLAWPQSVRSTTIQLSFLAMDGTIMRSFLKVLN